MDKKSIWLAVLSGSFALAVLGGWAVNRYQLSDSASNRVAQHQSAQEAAPQTQQVVMDKQVLSSSQIVAHLKKQLPQLTSWQDPQLVKLDGRTAYEVTTDKGKVYLDAGSGRILSQPMLLTSNEFANGGTAYAGNEGERRHGEDDEADDDDDGHHSDGEHREHEHKREH